MYNDNFQAITFPNEKFKSLFLVEENIKNDIQLEESLIDWEPIARLEVELLWHTPLVRKPY